MVLTFRKYSIALMQLVVHVSDGAGNLGYKPQNHQLPNAITLQNLRSLYITGQMPTGPVLCVVWVRVPSCCVRFPKWPKLPESQTLGMGSFKVSCYISFQRFSCSWKGPGKGRGLQSGASFPLAQAPITPSFWFLLCNHKDKNDGSPFGTQCSLLGKASTLDKQ